MPLLETRFSGKAPGFAEYSWSGDEPRIVMYLHRHGLRWAVGGLEAV